MGIRLRTKKLIYSGLIGAGAMLLVSSAGGYFIYQNTQEREIALKEEYQSKTEELQAIANQSEIGYALVSEVAKGTEITDDMLKKVYVPDAAAATDRYLTLEMIGTSNPLYARTDLTAHTILTSALVYEDENITPDVRKAEYSFIELPTKLKIDEYIDVRIQFPSGDDFVLFAKKKVTDLLGLTVWMNVSEGEILTMSSAIVDAYVEGAKIYAMPYVDEHMQDSSSMTYPVKTNVKELIQSSPNVVNVAKLNLEKQNRARMESALKQMAVEARSKVENGESATQSAVSEETEKRTAEEKINALNTEQEALIGGTNEGGKQ